VAYQPEVTYKEAARLTGISYATAARMWQHIGKVAWML